MEIDVISLRKMDETKRKLFWCFFYISMAGITLIAFILLNIFFENRTTATLWIIGGTIIGFLSLTSIAYVVVKMIWPLKSFLKMANKALSSERLINDVIITEEPKEVSSYGGYKSVSFLASEVDEKTTIHYSIDAEYSSFIKKGKRFEIEAYGGVISRIRDLDNTEVDK